MGRKPEASRKNIYQNDYSETSKRMTGFFQLMGIWRGSVVKLIYHNVLIFLVFYFMLSFLYRVVLFEDDFHRQMFEIICVYSQRFSSHIPITFLTGFYVSQVVSRWWGMFTCLPYPDRIALKLIRKHYKFLKNYILNNVQ
ncbi:bestrophin-2 [Eurytemora carolleeae]|uniref:bestrophin-2 n=1 Tax=Eurytemora carolleeae TaxID=1294199 RepID=UPI000C789493|nr:bestrophin-2 [Eurytemora carolleeae]|eukprot:XP_023337476.1 bestrophin-2-like [Eurytemora affinis]